MLKWYKADLHVHTVLSPCAELLMGPKNIIEQALKIGLDILAITDHNAAENVEAVIKIARGTNLTIIPGMEVTTREEAHFICLFPGLPELSRFQEIINKHLPPGENDPEFFGPQYIVNERNEVLGENSRLLILATSMSIKQVVALVHSLNGISYPAHVDRKAYSLLNQLGFVPHDLKLPAMEISWNCNCTQLIKKFPEAQNYPFIRASDAHDVDQMGRGYTAFYMRKPTLDEMMLAIRGENGRKITISLFTG